MTRLSPAWFADKRWFAAKGQGDEPGPVQSTTMDGDLSVSVVQVGQQHYQLVTTNGQADSLTDSSTGSALARAFTLGERGLRANGAAGSVEFHRLADLPLPVEPAWLLTGEQSNSSVVIDDRLILKVLRRLQAGPHPEVEMLSKLAGRGCAGVPRLAGWYETSGGPIDAVLGVLQEFVVDGTDGWRLVLDGLAIDSGATISLVNDLGRTLAQIHQILGQRDDDPAFAPEQGRPKLTKAISGSIAARCRHLADELADRPDLDTDSVGPGLIADLNEAADLAPRLADRLSPGPLIRHHGDLHLGQTLHTPRGWLIIDWEGEPDRPLAERRSKQPPLRDVAGMLRSFDYAAATHTRVTGGPRPEGWRRAARAAFLDGYLSVIGPDLIPAGPTATVRLLALLELEKLIYEIGYEAANRPDWLAIPAHSLRSVLEDQP